MKKELVLPHRSPPQVREVGLWQEVCGSLLLLFYLVGQFSRLLSKALNHQLPSDQTVVVLRKMHWGFPVSIDGNAVFCFDLFWYRKKLWCCDLGSLSEETISPLRYILHPVYKGNDPPPVRVRGYYTPDCPAMPVHVLSWSHWSEPVSE